LTKSREKQIFAFPVGKRNCATALRAIFPFFKRFLYVWAPLFDKWIASDLLNISFRDENIQAMGRAVEVQQVDIP
jgi:hypothetical protein